jgi:hypothetical protein
MRQHAALSIALLAFLGARVNAQSSIVAGVILQVARPHGTEVQIPRLRSE